MRSPTVKSKHRYAPPAHATWMRWVALWCALLFGVASTAQAAHIHDGGTGKGVASVHSQSNGSNSPADEEHCPLCVAVHWAMPTAMATAPSPVLAPAVLRRACVARPACLAWNYARFGRPPPVRA